MRILSGQQVGNNMILMQDGQLARSPICVGLTKVHPDQMQYGHKYVCHPHSSDGRGGLQAMLDKRMSIPSHRDVYANVGADERALA